MRLQLSPCQYQINAMSFRKIAEVSDLSEQSNVPFMGAFIGLRWLVRCCFIAYQIFMRKAAKALTFKMYTYANGDIRSSDPATTQIAGNSFPHPHLHEQSVSAYLRPIISSFVLRFLFLYPNFCQENNLRCLYMYNYSMLINS